MDSKGLVSNLEKRMDYKLTVKENEMIKNKAEFYRLDFFNAVLGDGIQKRGLTLHF